jgi:hypothetical protein
VGHTPDAGADRFDGLLPWIEFVRIDSIGTGKTAAIPEKL